MVVEHRSWLRIGLFMALAFVSVACTAGTKSEDQVSGSGEEVAVLTPPTWVRQAQSFQTPRVRVLKPTEGSVVGETVQVQVAFEGIRPAPVGRVRHGEGHWSVLANQPCIDAGKPTPLGRSGITVVSNGTLIGEIELTPGCTNFASNEGGAIVPDM